MTADELTRAMRAALSDEREGIKCLDHTLVARATLRKESIVHRLLATPHAERAPLLAALDALRDDLRDNLNLLAHARAYLYEATELSRTPEGRASLEVKHGVANDTVENDANDEPQFVLVTRNVG